MLTMLRAPLLNGDMKYYIEDIFEEALKADGFSCPNNRKLCWYRINENGIIQTIGFYLLWYGAPWVVMVAYGTHPLYFEPVYYSNSVFPQRPMNDFRFCELMVREATGKGFSIYSSEIPLSVPEAPGRGIYTYNEIIKPQLEHATTLETCYQLHKKTVDETIIRIQKECNNIYYFNIMNVNYVAEAILVEDKSMYPYCLQATNERIEFIKAKKRSLDKASKELLLELELQKKVLEGESREPYLHFLEQRKEKNIKMIRTKLKLSNT